MSQYYFIGTILPNLTLDSAPEINFVSLDNLLRDNLSQEDYEKTKVIRRFFDILNLRALWIGQEIDPRGELNANELEEAMINSSGLPDYIFEFLARYHTVGERIHHFPALLANFFRHANQEKDPFLKKYFTFERELRLVLTAYRAKKIGRDLSIELQYEDPEEILIAELLEHKDDKVFEIPEKFEDLKSILDKNEDDPMALERALDEYRFNYIDQLVDMADVFSIDRILAYMAQLTVVEKWFGLDKKAGLKIVDTIAKGT
jgi:hypothetical protein